MGDNSTSSSSSGSGRPGATAFPLFLRLPTVLQHEIYSFAPRRSLLTRYAHLCKAVHSNTRALVATASSREPRLTKRVMHGWIARLDAACSAMRHSVLSSCALDPNDMALLYVSVVPPKSGVDPLAPVPAARAYTGDPQAPHRRALDRLREQSLHHAHDGAAPFVPILRESNVCDSLQRTPIAALQDASVHKILNQARWVLSAHKAVWRASLLQKQRDEMERLQQRHEDLLNADEPSDFDYCDAEDGFTAEMDSEVERWENETKDLLFELRFVLLAMLTYAAAQAAEEAAEVEAAVAEMAVTVPGGATISAPVPAPSSASSSSSTSAVTAAAAAPSPCLYSLERVHINDPEQDLPSTEGRVGCRYTTHVHVFPLAKSRAQEEAEAEIAEALALRQKKQREAEEEAERVRAMMRRMEGTEPRLHSASSSDSEVGPLGSAAALRRAQAEQLRLEMLAAFKGTAVPERLANKYSEQVQQAAAAVAGQPAAAATPAAAAGAGSSIGASARRVEGFDLPYFFIATSHFRDEKRANNSRRSMAIR